MNELRETVSSQMTELLKLSDLSQAALAKESGVSKSTISKAINEGKLSVKTALKISASVGLSLDFLYGRSDVTSTSKYAFDILNKHILAFNKKSVWNGKTAIAAISFSQLYSAYLEKVCEAKNANVSEKVRSEWLQEAAEDFLKEIETDTDQRVDYALVDIGLLTDKVFEQLEIAKREIQGN